MDEIIRETAILFLSSNLSDETISAVIRRIYNFVPPLSRFSILKYVTLDWLLHKEFILVDGCLNSKMLEKDSFNFDCDGIPIIVSFIEFTRTDSPYYRVQFLDDDSVMNAIRVYKATCPLFLKKDEIPKEEVLFVREFHSNLDDAVLKRMIVMKLQGLQSDGPNSISGPILYRNDTLSVSPPRNIVIPTEVPVGSSRVVEPMLNQEIPLRRSRSPLSEPPSTPYADLSTENTF